MKIKSVYVEDLFGSYTYELDLIDDECVTIIHALNGKGKTTVLKLIQAAFDCDATVLEATPFKKFVVRGTDGKEITVEKNDTFLSMADMSPIDMRRERARNAKENDENENRLAHFENIIYSFNDKSFTVKIRPDAFTRPMSGREREMMYASDGFYSYTIGEAFERHILQKEEVFDVEELSEALKEYVGDMSIHFIKANRLTTRVDGYARRRDWEYSTSTAPTVEVITGKIKEKLAEAGEQYSIKAQESDRSFPKRTVEAIVNNKKNPGQLSDTDTIVKNLEELEKQRERLSNMGMITDTGKDEFVKIPKGEILSDDTIIFLMTYIEDNIAKLHVYNGIVDKFELFRNIINTRNEFSDKYMKYDAKKGVIFISKTNGREIQVSKLSSGEKNEFVLYYELIFNCDSNALVLIDEPEISLHVSWQRNFIKELLEICGRSMQSIVATHSPDIVDVYDDLMIDLINQKEI